MHYLKWLYPGMKFKRWLLLFSVGVIAASLGLAMVFNYKYIGFVEETIFRMVYLSTGKYDYTATFIAGLTVTVLGLLIMTFATRKIIRSVVTVLVPEGADKLVELIFEKRKLNRGPNVAVIGGGTGLSVLLRGIKNVTSNITAIVTVADDGGSSGRLRQDLGIIPPGDLRSCLVALADTEPLMEKLFQHRFGGTGTLAGHSFGNLYIAAMTEVVGGDVELALKQSSKVLAVRGQVLPSSVEAIRLVATMTDGTVVEGESRIPLVNKRIARVAITPPDVKPVQAALDAITEAEAVVLGPGSLYTSVLPNLLIQGMAEALKKTHAVKIYICNVMTQPGETDGFSAYDHVKAILDHVGPCIDYVVVNSQKVAPELQGLYAEQGAYPVAVDVPALESLGVRVVEANLISETNLVRHDPVKLSRTIMSMVYKLKANPERMKLLDYYLISEHLKKLKDNK